MATVLALKQSLRQAGTYVSPTVTVPIDRTDMVLLEVILDPADIANPLITFTIRLEVQQEDLSWRTLSESQCKCGLLAAPWIKQSPDGIQGKDIRSILVLPLPLNIGAQLTL